MKTKKIILYVCALLACIAATKSTFAQQQPAHSKLSVVQPMRNSRVPGNLSAKVFTAPNKTYGYDILSNGKLIYHQPAFSKNPHEGNISVTKKEQANTAAMVSIEKIRSGKNPQLSNEELQKIIAHN